MSNMFYVFLVLFLFVSIDSNSLLENETNVTFLGQLDEPGSSRNVTKRGIAGDNQISCEESYNTVISPYVVVIRRKQKNFFKGLGSLVKENVVLTIEGVVEKTNKTNILVVAGSRKASWGRYSQVRRVRKIVYVKGFGLLQLMSPFILSDKINLISIPQLSTQRGFFSKQAGTTTGTAAGFLYQEEVPEIAVYMLVEEFMCESPPPDIYDSKTEICTEIDPFYSSSLYNGFNGTGLVVDRGGRILIGAFYKIVEKKTTVHKISGAEYHIYRTVFSEIENLNKRIEDLAKVSSSNLPSCTLTMHLSVVISWFWSYTRN